MEDIWRKKLEAKGWSNRAIVQFPYAWASSTQKQYEQIINRLYVFCAAQGYFFPPDSSACIVDFLCQTADKSTRPESVLKCTSAAITWLYAAKDLPNLMLDSDVQKMITALIKSGTKVPRSRSSVMPIEPFTSLFLS